MKPREFIQRLRAYKQTSERHTERSKTIDVKVKIKLSLYRPGGTLGVPGG
jgi:hypothetical protein